ncbi:mannonate dehydratase [Kaistia algarum]|uniref:mannonate dehydratase n=1 Tax=Kaistia algarum TaxID=2083279 RepID=UPI000CE9328B|nr:mannonate dehydratase [Kaistia algarum]MCX5516437.1 mannonate dehydratase [Kaistia algarum]PPE77472.1 mannonate dehydratase [Kaistia algarum]
MEQTWRWFGPNDEATLGHARQAGATGIVTALHDIPYGETWSVEAIRERQRVIEADAAMGLRWSVVESVPVHEDIKLGRGDLDRLYENFRQTLTHLGACGVRTVCYNFMLILDWTRTDLAVKLPGGARALKLNMNELAAFDCHILKRPGAERDYTPDVLQRAAEWFDHAGEEGKARLWANVMAGLPGAFKRYDVAELRDVLAEQSELTHDQLRANLVQFLKEILPAAEKAGVVLCIHPDDPPRNLAGLCRIVKNAGDIAFILDAVPSEANGLTLCTGSLGANPENDVPAIARRFAGRVKFAHLRNVKKDPDGSFMESDHLGGDVDMVAVVETLLDEQQRRRLAGEPTSTIPFRPDHGHDLIDDGTRQTHPGYPVVGRLRGLAEIRGVMTALAHQKGYAL